MNIDTMSIEDLRKELKSRMALCKKDYTDNDFSIKAGEYYNIEQDQHEVTIIDDNDNYRYFSYQELKSLEII